MVKLILHQVDQDGYHSLMLEAILDHAKDGRAVEQKNQWIVSKRGRRSMSKTTVSWKFQVQEEEWDSHLVIPQGFERIKSSRRCSVCDIERHPE